MIVAKAAVARQPFAACQQVAAESPLPARAGSRKRGGEPDHRRTEGVAKWVWPIGARRYCQRSARSA